MKKSYLYAAGAILLWSTMPTISKLMLGELDSYTLLCVSSLWAAVALIIVSLCSGKWSIIKSYRFTDYLKMAAIGAPGVFIYYVLYYEGTTRMLASQAFIINYLWPIMSIVFACILLREKLTLRKAIAVAMSFLGVFTVAGGDILRFDADVAIGTLCCFGAAVCYGLFTALTKKSQYDTQIVVTVSMITSFVGSLALVWLRGGAIAIIPAQIPGILWNGVGTMAIANLSWALALSSGNTAKVSNLAYITPFLSLVWTCLVLGEPIQPMSVIGLCLIIAGVFVQLKDGRQKSV